MILDEKLTNTKYMFRSTSGSRIYLVETKTNVDVEKDYVGSGLDIEYMEELSNYIWGLLYPDGEYDELSSFTNQQQEESILVFKGEMSVDEFRERNMDA